MLKQRDPNVDFVYYEIDKTRAKDKTYIWMSVRWKTRNERWWIYMSHIHWVGRDTGNAFKLFIINRESETWELQTRPIYDCRCDERLEPKYDEFTWLAYTGLFEELEYLNIETRLTDEKFASVMGLGSLEVCLLWINKV